MSKKIQLWKKYKDGDVRAIEVNDTKENVMHLIDHGFFLSEKEAKSGKVEPEKVEKAEKAEKTPKVKAKPVVKAKKK